METRAAQYLGRDSAVSAGGVYVLMASHVWRCVSEMSVCACVSVCLCLCVCVRVCVCVLQVQLKHVATGVECCVCLV